jgi:Uma2 family endonuclease
MTTLFDAPDAPELVLEHSAHGTLPHTMPHTLAEYLAAPEGVPYFQFINGNPALMPSPTLFHQTISMNLSFLFMLFVREHRLGSVFAAPLDVYFSEREYYQPDLIFISHEQAHIKQERVQGAPDLVVEILSPSNAADDLTHKRLVYEEFGVKEYWIVNPEDRSVTVLANMADGFRQHSFASQDSSEKVVESALLADFSVSVDAVFSA